MTTTKDLEIPQRITVLKHLAGGKPIDVTATITGLTAETVLDLASHHGYPDRDKLAWAVDVLTKKHADTVRGGIPAGTATTTRSKKGRPLPKGEHPCRHDGCDRVYDTPQGRSLHERMKCEHRPAEEAS